MASVLPTASTKDTEQTKQEVGVFRTLFIDLCPKPACENVNIANN